MSHSRPITAIFYSVVAMSRKYEGFVEETPAMVHKRLKQSLQRGLTLLPENPETKVTLMNAL